MHQQAKRMILGSVLIASFFMSFAIISNNQEPENYDSGRVRLLKIMNNNEGITAKYGNNVRYVETQNIVHDLNIEEIARFFECKTIIGHTYLTQSLALPVTKEDRTIIEARQSRIHALVERPRLLKKLSDLIEEAKKQEQEIVKLLSEQFIGRTCPELEQLKMIEKQNPGMYPIINFLHTSPLGKIYSTTMNYTALFTTAAGLCFFGNKTFRNARLGYMYADSAIWTVYLGLLEGLYGYVAYKDYSTAFEKRRTMHALNRFIDIAEQCEALCSANGIETDFKISRLKETDFGTIIEKLKHARYQEKDTYFFLTPPVHSFLYELYENDHRLASLFACIAETDVYQALATKMVESTTSNNKLCFVHFNENEQSIHMQGFWNVMVPHAVVNDIHEHKHIVLSGPNAGGKTTSIRSVLQNIVLGQTYGVAAAATCKFNFFDVIHSYLNISDDLKNGLSLFASEVKRAKEIIERIKSLDGKKYFFALDELFTGTMAEDGETCALHFIQKIAEFDDVQFIYATHYRKLMEQADVNPRITNYQVNSPTKNAANILVYPYTFGRGANTTCVAVDLAMQANLFA